MVDELLKVTHLGKWEVECYIPNRERFKSGVISPISISSDIALIKDIIATKYKVHEVERLNRRTDQGWVPSTALKVIFDEVSLPGGLKIGHSFYKVRPFVGLPVQCYRCQRLGHTAQGCRAKVRCLVCGGEHNKEVCNSQQLKCANCGGDHTANSKHCNLMKKAQ